MSDATVVINAAGCGSRLGQEIPKSLVAVSGKTILEWQLSELCRTGDHVRIVVGYMGEQVAKLAKAIFPSIEVLYNPWWKETKTAASLSIGVAGLSGRVVSLDGDLLVMPLDFRQMLASHCDLIGVTDVKTSQPVYAEVDKLGVCHRLSYENISQYEWTGLVNFVACDVPPSMGNVFEMIDSILPTRFQSLRCVEVDTPEDLNQASRLWPELLEQPCIIPFVPKAPAVNTLPIRSVA